MRQALSLCSSLFALVVAAHARGADWYVSPTGTATSGCTTRAAPCDLASAAAGAIAGDTVILMDGVYKTAIYVANSGTGAAWITFKADECSTPIIEGEGSGPTDDMQTSGVHSKTAEYLRFEGIVARGWNIGFGNGWADGVNSTAVSNGHWEIKHCISYSNGRTGFTFFSASDFTLINSIAAHNGSSQKHAWSSGVTLFEASGTNRVEGVISFENTDQEKRTDGSGFIVDEASNNATFVNNVAFRNSGSCFRLTDSSGTKFINNTCFQNSQFGSQATGPTNPGEIYFTAGGGTTTGVTFKNNVIVGTGQSPAGTPPIQNQPASGWTNNVVVTNPGSLFTAPTGTNPNFMLGSGATDLIGKGSGGDGVPTHDVGFDPKCIVKRQPQMVGQVARLSGWEFDVDIDYIKSIGGVAKCFNPGARSGTPDIGAYKNGPVTTAMPGACPLPPVGGGGAGGAGGTSGAGGIAGGAGGATIGGAAGAGGASLPNGGASTGGVGAAPGTAGSLSVGGGLSAGTGGAPGTAGTPTTVPSAGTGTTSTGGAPTTSTAGSPGGPMNAGNLGVGGVLGPVPRAPAEEESGCGCRTAPQPSRPKSLAALGLFGLGALALQRRRRKR
jgi:MYXO-CTERM domain-containing protein